MLRRFRLHTILVLAATIATASAPPSWADGPRLRVRMEEPFEVAGRVYPAGVLTLRSINAYNPSSSIDEIWIGGSCLGALVADKVFDGTTVSEDTVLFERNAAGRLALVGYMLRGDGVENSYRYRPATIAGNRMTAQLAIR